MYRFISMADDERNGGTDCLGGLVHKTRPVALKRAKGAEDHNQVMSMFTNSGSLMQARMSFSFHSVSVLI